MGPRARQPPPGDEARVNEAGKAGLKGMERIPLDSEPMKSLVHVGNEGQETVMHPPRVGLMRDEWIAEAHIHESALLVSLPGHDIAAEVNGNACPV